MTSYVLRTTSTASSLKPSAIATPGGTEAVQLRVAEQYVKEFGALAKSTNTVIMPATVSDVGSMIAMAMSVFRSASPIAGTTPAGPRPPGAPLPRAKPVGE